MPHSETTALTPVEAKALDASPFKALYPPREKITTLVVDSFPALGRLAAMRFLEWAQNNPGGVISLPTGKTPEHFIKWVMRALAEWETAEMQQELAGAGVDPDRRPDMQSLHFVQIDEFYPIDPRQDNSFFSYVNRFYIKGFGLDRTRALLIDCREVGLEPGQSLEQVWPDGEVDLSLRYRAPLSHLEQLQSEVLSRIDQWCQEYEDRIRALGGIGFFLGGIGPDGHIGFNVRGSDHRSTTRLCEVNYETHAAAAGDLGGIEVARRRLVITIGLGTIAADPECAAIVTAAGEAKAGIVARAIEEDGHIRHPGSVLHGLVNARFYLTAGAAKHLEDRQVELVEGAPVIDEAEAERVVVDLALKLRRRVIDLSAADVAADRAATAVLARRGGTAQELMRLVRDRLVAKIERGTTTRSQTSFLHTEPHHDDIMLGYLSYIVRHVRDASNSHHFACFTGGFTAVTNLFILANVEHLRVRLDSPEFARLMEEDYFAPDNAFGRNRDVWHYLDGVAAMDEDVRNEGAARRFLRNLMALYGDRDLSAVRGRLDAFEHYFAHRYPGQKDSDDVQRLKSMCREWEAECIWGYFGWDCANVRHLRLGFYTGDIFTKEPSVEADVLPVIRLLDEVQPDVVSVALDPEASGPDTHYKVLQSVTEALKRYEQTSGRHDLRVWGYRNVWYRFHPSEADIFVPVSLNMFAIMDNAFVNTFISQRDASFPSPEHDGPFSELAQQIQVEQYEKMKVCLGREWFHEHPSALIRGTRGLVYLTDLSLEQFYKRSRELKQAAENA